jgi:hypothetical protein
MISQVINTTNIDRSSTEIESAGGGNRSDAVDSLQSGTSFNHWSEIESEKGAPCTNPLL